MTRDLPPPKFPQPCRVRLSPDRHSPAAWEWDGHWYVVQAVLGAWKECWVGWDEPDQPIHDVSVFRLLATDRTIAEVAYAHREQAWGIRRLED